MRIVVLHSGGIGDLVLAESLLSGLRHRYPDARLELFCRDDVAEVPALYDRPPDAVRAFPFNPYTWATPHEAIEPSANLLAELPPGPVDLFISAELRRTWFSEILAAKLAPAEAIFGDASLLDRSTVRIVVRRLGLRLRPHVERLAPIPGEHELDRYARLARGERRLPQLRSLRRRSAKKTRPLVVFPLGVPGLKHWPLDRFLAACTEIRAGNGHPLLLVGSESERPQLESLASWAPADSFGVCSPGKGGLARVADSIANAWGYLGIDTGLAHLAAAYGVPGVTVYGGGTWPAYAPWAPHSAGVVAPIPCFGCFWDCAFGHAYCIEAVPVDDVVRAFGAAHAAVTATVVAENEAYGTRERTIFGEAARSYRGAQADRAARLRAIIRLRDILERYAHRSRTRPSHTSPALEHVTHRLTILANRLNEQVSTRT
jgi:ADP-heptose:LPS heptosyltransferase